MLDRIEQIKQRQKLKGQYVPVVGPNGEFLMPKMIPYENKDGGYNTTGGSRIVVWSDALGEYVVHREFPGWTLYMDMCKDKPKYYEDWVKIASALSSGAYIKELPDDFYHPEVYKRRSGFKFGKAILDVSEILGDKKKAGRPKKELDA